MRLFDRYYKEERHTYIGTREQIEPLMKWLMDRDCWFHMQCVAQQWHLTCGVIPDWNALNGPVNYAGDYLKALEQEKKNGSSSVSR